MSAADVGPGGRDSVYFPMPVLAAATGGAAAARVGAKFPENDADCPPAELVDSGGPENMSAMSNPVAEEDAVGRGDEADGDDAPGKPDAEFCKTFDAGFGLEEEAGEGFQPPRTNALTLVTSVSSTSPPGRVGLP